MKKIEDFWLNFFQTEHSIDNWWTRKKELCKEQNKEIVKIDGNGHLSQKLQYDNEVKYDYSLYVSFLIKQGDYFHMEERVIPYQFVERDGEIVSHQEIQLHLGTNEIDKAFSGEELKIENKNERFAYDRHAAVQYAERWWNSYNPAFKKFDVDCTNFISQCLFAGRAPMRGAPNRNNGWWYQSSNWSYSWAVAHSLRWYLSGSTSGLRGKEMKTANELYPGDVICYDFEGNGKWDHNTIVVAKDANDMPLVNAHTNNSRNRYWSYVDSAAWTPNIQYKFFRIGET